MLHLFQMDLTCIPHFHSIAFQMAMFQFVIICAISLAITADWQECTGGVHSELFLLLSLNVVQMC